MTAARRTIVALVVSSILLPLVGCFSPPPRRSIPPELVETAQVPGYEHVRYWADELTSSFSDGVLEQYRQVQASAKAGINPGMLSQVTFLAISGGGENGAFAAGLLAGWASAGTRPKFETVTGVSAGALAAPFAFLGPKYDGALEEIYTRYDAAHLYTSRILGFFSNALDDTAPLRRLIESYVTDAFLDEVAGEYRIGRRLLVASTDLDAERPMFWDLSAIAASGNPGRKTLFVDLLLASSAIPGLFPPMVIPVRTQDGQMYTELHIDGGATAELVFAPPNISLASYEDKVFGKRRERTLYVIRNGKLAPESATTPERALDIAERAVSTLVKNQVLANLRLLARAAREGGTNLRFVAVPSSFSTAAQTDFDTAYTKKLFEAGRQVGRAGQWDDKPAETPELEAR